MAKILHIRINSMPDPGGSPINDTEAQINGTGSVPLGATAPGEYPITGAAAGDDVAIRAVNSGGALDFAGLATKTVPGLAAEAAGGIADQTFAEGDAITPLDVSADFDGTAPITYALAPSSAAPPAGLSLSSTGTISGTPTTEAAAVSIVVRGTNAYGSADTAFGVTVQAATSGVLLDDYPGAAVALSLRQLKTGVTNVARVRRQSDSLEADFTAADFADNSVGVWAGGTAWLHTLYDQSGNGLDSVQTSVNNQLQVVDSGGNVLTKNGVPCAVSAGDAHASISGLQLTADCSLFFAVENEAQTAGDSIHRPFFAGDTTDHYGTDPTGYAVGLSRDGSDAVRAAFPTSGTGALNDVAITLTTDDTMLVVSTVSSGGSHLLAVNSGTTITTSAAERTTGFTTGYRICRGIDAQTSRDWEGYFGEVIAYNSDQSVNRTLIEANIASHYGVTLT